MPKVEGALPEEIKDQLTRWNEQRDWNLKHNFFGAAIACAQNAEMIFDRWYSLRRAA